ncbi:hypothetical protein BaRGS_00031307 [Batillaria attramentaria]|uniref:Uncharacterized protein n=1 Tax=Batillaria attramentaria TaxID=370345 RepID=A0ABD0JRL9_9CAEN
MCFCTRRPSPKSKAWRNFDSSKCVYLLRAIPYVTEKWGHQSILREILRRSAQLQPCQALSTPRGEVIQVNPKISLFDQRVHITVQGLPQNAKVTLHASTDSEWRRAPVKFVSCSHFVTGQGGEVDLHNDASLGGSYTGVDPMGLFSSMQPSPAGPRNIRMVLKNVDNPCLYTLSVYSGHLTLSDLHTSHMTHPPLSVTTIPRLAKALDVRRVPVREGRVRGTLFLPPGEGPHQGVIDMFGFAGGLMEFRAAMLASHGFAALSLAFFGYEDLPAGVGGVEFDYFQEAAQWLSSHPNVKNGGVGVVAVSGGAAFASLMAWKCPEVVASVHINGPPFYIFRDLYRKGKLFRKGVRLDRSLTPYTDEGLSTKPGYLYKLEDFIPVWESSTRVLLLISGDDEQIQPEFGDMLYDMYPEDKRHLIEVVHYPGAGHLLEPPYTPYCRHCHNPPFATSRLRHLHHILQRSVQLQPCQTFSTLTSVPDLIQVTPRVSLFDEKVHIRVQGLPSNAKVTLSAATQQEWRREPVLFASCSHHVATETGEVDLNTNRSLGGSYTGVDPMGLFWSIQPSPKNVRMVLKDVEKPVIYTLSVYSGHVDLADLRSASSEGKCTPLASTTIQRYVKAVDVKRIPIKEGSVRGTLFLPPGEGPHQGVIDMFGLAGGLMETRGAMLASRGFATLCLPFFRFDDLPQDLSEVQFDYFEEAAGWLSSHRAVRDGGIGVVGTSGGALFALFMAWKCPEVTAVVRINGPPFVGFHSVYWKGELLAKGNPLDITKFWQDGEGVDIKDGFVYKLEDFVPVWETSTRLLTLISDDDGQMKPELGALQYDMYPEDKRHLIEVVHYPGAGHLLEPPYTPHCRYCYNPTFNTDLQWGGYVKEHAEAQEDSWKRILHFFRTNLPQ